MPVPAAVAEATDRLGQMGPQAALPTRLPWCPCECDWKTPACTNCPHVKEICYRRRYTETPEKKGAGARLPSAKRFTGSAPFFSVQHLGFSFWGSCSATPLAFLPITIQYMRQMLALLVLVLKAH